MIFVTENVLNEWGGHLCYGWQHSYTSTLMKKHSVPLGFFWGVGLPSRHIRFLFPGHDSGPPPVSNGSVQQVLHLGNFFPCFCNFTPHSPLHFNMGFIAFLDPFNCVLCLGKLCANMSRHFFYNFFTMFANYLEPYKETFRWKNESRLVLNAGADDSAAWARSQAKSSNAKSAAGNIKLIEYFLFWHFCDWVSNFNRSANV